MTGKSNLAEGANLNPNSVFKQSEVSGRLHSEPGLEGAVHGSGLPGSEPSPLSWFLAVLDSILALPSSLQAAET